MISLTKLLSDVSSYGDELRYRRLLSSPERRPIVVWNCTRQCNLSCRHCYSDSCAQDYAGELSTDEARGLIAQLQDFHIPVLLFSGGEPLLRKDLFELNALARRSGLRTVISTNGTLITRDMAGRIKGEGFDYVGVSLDGVGERNDSFRGQKGAFDRALAGIRNLVAVGQKVGLRFTITRHNVEDVPAVLKLAEDEGIGRICFYHLAYAGRGADIRRDDITAEETRQVIDRLGDWVESLSARGISKEVLTVDNHADGVYLYLRLFKNDPGKAERVRKLLAINGGNASGIAIANIDHQGYVHPDQFWPQVTFGNVRERAFGEIWTDTSHEIMGKLKDRKAFLKGRCGRCAFVDLCNGNLRSRALAVSGDMWAEDPACYLTEEEISKK